MLCLIKSYQLPIPIFLIISFLHSHPFSFLYSSSFLFLYSSFSHIQLYCNYHDSLLYVSEVLHLYTPNFLVYQPRACYGSVFPLPSELPLQPSSYQYICGNPYSMLLGNLYYPISHVHCASHQGALPLHRLIQYSNCNSHRWALCCCLDY